MKTAHPRSIVYRVWSIVGIFVFSSILYTAYFIPSTYALSVASTYRVGDTQAVSGDIVEDVSGQGLVRSQTSYSSHLFGVIEDDPLAVYRNTTPDQTDQPILRTGDVTVNVTDFNGKIAVGDYITASPIPGKGMKATQSGYVIGIATSTTTDAGSTTYQGRKLTSQQVTVSLQIEYAEISTAKSTVRLFESINAALFRSVQDPEKFTLIVRYIIAGLVVLVTFILGFGAFSRAVAKGIEAIGRNPLARGAIQTSIFVEIAMTIITCLAGVVIAYVIVKF